MTVLRGVVATAAIVGCMTSCVADDDEVVTYGETSVPIDMTFKLSNGSMLSKVYDGKIGDGQSLLDIRRDRDGKISSVRVGDEDYVVSHEPFRIELTGYTNKVDRWRAFKFTQNGYISSCVRDRSNAEGEERSTTYTLAYDNKRLLSVHANGDGWCVGDEGVVSWTRSMDANFTWRNGTIAVVTLNDRERESKRDLTDVVYTYDYTYGTTDNQFRQMPVLLCEAIADLQVFVVLGMLGEGPMRIPNGGNVVRSRNLVAGKDRGYSTESLLIDIERAAGGEIGRENSYRYVYKRQTE